MKKILVLMSAITLMWCSLASAQTTAPEKVNAQFKTLYPNVKDVKWVMEDGNYLGLFTSDKKEMAVQINEKGDLVQTEKRLDISELPKASQEYLTKNYAGVKFDRASEVTDDSKVKRYQAVSKDKTVVFDADGKFLGDSSHNGW